jgi:hypothetical protein
MFGFLTIFLSHPSNGALAVPSKRVFVDAMDAVIPMIAPKRNCC